MFYVTMDQCHQNAKTNDTSFINVHLNTISVQQVYKAHIINARMYDQKICSPLREQSQNNTSTGGQVRREASEGSLQLSSFPSPQTKTRRKPP